MKTEISRFCEACLSSLQPFPPALRKAAEGVEHAPDEELLSKPLAALNDIRARLRSLVEKLENQQAYLLIFGPLKSGKSTLMNAISGTYVSEVTSLPGYPCLVFVQHAADAHFSATRYNGRQSVFANGSVLKQVIDDSHVALAQQIRATESEGADFDPRHHFTEAIRRIDIKVPVPALAESSTVLVDTPGLYSRMNFGYDVLTREFRDSAACAVFVVKTDNLFLEQVFNEFNQLLGLFSRIFLVINVDSNKRDLQADGTLLPSAESAHPEQIIDAFKTLSMAGPLRQAYEENRVRIHAVDLLSAASAFLRPRENGEALPPDPHRAAFDAFSSDLTAYLNSSDYTVEFIRDSLRQGATLCEEARAVYAGAEMQELREKQSALAAEIQGYDDRIGTVDRLLKVDWEATFEQTRSTDASVGAESAKARATVAAKEARAELDHWYASGESLQTLIDNHWTPLLAQAAGKVAEESRTRLHGLLNTPIGGAEPSATVMNDLHSVGFSLARVTQSVLAKINGEDDGELYRVRLSVDEIPVRKSFVDWILFRSQAGVRRRLFGEDLTQPISPEVKARRLPELSREALVDAIDRAVKSKFPALPLKFSGELLTGYVKHFCAAVREGLRELRANLVGERSGHQQPFDQNADVLNAMDGLHERAASVSAELTMLAQKENAGPIVATPKPYQRLAEAEIAKGPEPSGVSGIGAASAFNS